MRDAEEYTISVRVELIDGERVYVARVDELPDVEEYADSYEFARELALDTIQTTQAYFSENGMRFPEPKNFVNQDVSGRVTLRLPKSVHANCIVNAEKEGVSLNSYILTCITSYRPLQDSSVRASFFEDLKKSILALSAPKENANLISNSAFAYSKKGHFNVVLSSTDAEEYELRTFNAQSAFRGLRFQKLDNASPC